MFGGLISKPFYIKLLNLYGYIGFSQSMRSVCEYPARRDEQGAPDWEEISGLVAEFLIPLR